MQDMLRSRKTLARLGYLGRRISAVLATRTDLLHQPYRSQVEGGAHPLTGHCYVAVEALYHMGAKDAGYRPKVMRVDTGTHWYLEGPKGKILDPTRAQFPESLDYTGRGCGFLTTQPSRRCTAVLDFLC